MNSQIAQSGCVCKSGLAAHLLCAVLLGAMLLCAAAERAQAQTEIQSEIQSQIQADVNAPVIGLVNWPGTVVYPKLNEGMPLMTISAGEKVELLERSNLWWKVLYGGQVGWINRLFIEEDVIEDPPAQIPRSVFQMSMLALDNVWKSKFQKRALDTAQPEEPFTAQLIKNSKMPWAPQVIAPSRLRIGRDYFKLWLKAAKAGYVYVWSEAEDGELTLVFPNQRDVDNRVSAGEVLYLPRNNWPIKSTGPAGKARLLVMVSEVPRALPPPESLMEEVSLTLASPSMPSLLGHEILKRHPFWMSTKTSLGNNAALLHFLNPDLSKVDCNPKKPQCSNNYGVKSVKLMKVEPIP
jgi:hypothetical protein